MRRYKGFCEMWGEVQVPDDATDQQAQKALTEHLLTMITEGVVIGWWLDDGPSDSSDPRRTDVTSEGRP